MTEPRYYVCWNWLNEAATQQGKAENELAELAKQLANL